jgi:hypothetical protein
MIYLKHFLQVLKTLKLNKLYESPDFMVRYYEKLAHRCSDEGYDDYLVEFDNDLSIRGHIEKVLTMDELNSFEEFKGFRAKVNVIDNVLQGAFIPGVERKEGAFWWQRGILRKGEGDYANDVKEVYGINLPYNDHAV